MRIIHAHYQPPLGLHKLPNGVKSKFFKELEKGRNYVLPTNADEFQEMMELVLYNPKWYTFHQRMRDALVKMQMPNYVFFEESKKTPIILVLTCFATIELHSHYFLLVVVLWCIVYWFEVDDPTCHTSIIFAVQQDLLNGTDDAELIQKLVVQINAPTLILWGDHDRVSLSIPVSKPLLVGIYSPSYLVISQGLRLLTLSDFEMAKE